MNVQSHYFHCLHAKGHQNEIKMSALGAGNLRRRKKSNIDVKKKIRYVDVTKKLHRHKKFRRRNFFYVDVNKNTST